MATPSTSSIDRLIDEVLAADAYDADAVAVRLVDAYDAGTLTRAGLIAWIAKAHREGRKTSYPQGVAIAKASGYNVSMVEGSPRPKRREQG